MTFKALPWFSLNKELPAVTTTQTHVFSLVLSPLWLISGCYMSEWALCALQCSGWSLMPANVQPAKAGRDCVWVYKKWNNTGHVTRELRRRGWSIESTRLLLTLRHRCLCSCGDKEGNVCPSARLWPAKTSSCWATLSAPGNSKLWMNVEKHRYKYTDLSWKKLSDTKPKQQPQIES